MIGRLDIDLLATLVAIAETGGFTRAAERLNRTQPAVSMQMRRLEERVGKPLFLRQSRSVQLTVEGEALLAYAKRIVELTEEARHHLSIPQLSGVARVGIPEWYATDHLQAMLCRFARAHPDVRLEVFVSASHELRDRLERNELDIALAICDFFENTPTTVWREPLYWVAADGHIDGDINPVPLALFHAPCPYRDTAMRVLTQIGRHWTETFTSTSVASVRAALLSGLGVSIFPAGAVKAGLRILSPENGFPELPPTRLSIYRARPQIPEAADYLAKYLTDYVSAALDRSNDRPLPLGALQVMLGDGGAPLNGHNGH